MSDERERIEAIVQTAVHEAVDAAAEADPHYASSQWTAEGLTEIRERAVEALIDGWEREPVAWGIFMPGHEKPLMVELFREHLGRYASLIRKGATIVPLYRHPEPEEGE